jgi:hypothetical protein
LLKQKERRFLHVWVSWDQLAELLFPGAFLARSGRVLIGRIGTDPPEVCDDDGYLDVRHLPADLRVVKAIPDEHYTCFKVWLESDKLWETCKWCGEAHSGAEKRTTAKLISR